MFDALFCLALIFVFLYMLKGAVDFMKSFQKQQKKGGEGK